jgi:hypothetical protein
MASAEKLSDKENKQVETSPNKTTSTGEYRETNMSFMKKLMPDVEITDGNYTEVAERAMAEHMIPKLKAYGEANDNLKAMMHGEQKLAKILTDMAQGAKFEEVLPRYVDVENLRLEPGDPDYSTWEANNKKRKMEYKENLDRQTQLENNQMASRQNIEKFFEEKGMDDEAKGEYGAFVGNMLDRAYAGEITPEFLNKMYHAMKYKDDVQAAEAAGAIKVKNEKIVEKKMRSKKGDGLPVINGGGSAEQKGQAPDNADALTKSLRAFTGKKSVLGGDGY